MRLRALLAACALRRAACASLVGASSPAAAPSPQALAAAAGDPLLRDQLAGLRAGRAEGSCFDACGSCWYEAPEEPASVLCCCTPDCPVFGDCCADVGAVCTAPLASGAPISAIADVPEAAAPLPAAEESAAAPLGAVAPEPAVAPTPQPAMPLLLPTRPTAPPPLQPQPLPDGAILPLAPRTALCGSACGGCLYADARLPATKLCCCLPDCLLYNDCCLDFREACAGVGLPPAPPERPFLPMAPAPAPPSAPPPEPPPLPSLADPVVRSLPRGTPAAALLPERQTVSFVLRAPAWAVPDGNFAESYRRSISSFADARPSDVAVTLLRGGAAPADGEADAVPFFGELFLGGGGGNLASDSGGPLLRTDVSFPAGSRSAPGALIDAVLSGLLGETLSAEFPALAPLEADAPTLHAPADNVEAFQLRPAPPVVAQPEAIGDEQEEAPMPPPKRPRRSMPPPPPPPPPPEDDADYALSPPPPPPPADEEEGDYAQPPPPAKRPSRAAQLPALLRPPPSPPPRRGPVLAALEAALRRPSPPPPSPPPPPTRPQRGLAPLSFCAQRSAARYYAAPRSCDCGCESCDCRGYWSCWGCDGAGCRYGRYYECEKAPQSTFLDAAQACGWSRPARNIFACPPARSPPPPEPRAAPPEPPLPKPKPRQAPYPPWPPYDPFAGGGPGAGSCVGACGRCLQSGAAFLCCCDAPCMMWRLTPGQPPGFLGCCADAAAACPANKTATPPPAAG